MDNKIEIEEFLEKSENIPIVDVRSPKEFSKGHIPGAVNIPLFNDEERALVGTKYKKESREAAIELSLKITGPKLTHYVKQVKKIADLPRPLLTPVKYPPDKPACPPLRFSRRVGRISRGEKGGELCSPDEAFLSAQALANAEAKSGSSDEALAKSGKNEILVHCWRGGMRSNSMAWLFNTCNLKATTLIGGYKSYRHFIRKSFEQKANIIILGGMTGSGKSDILSHISKSGHQILDIENIAEHKGSAFGAIGQKQQPTNEQFENNLHQKWKNFDFNHPIWIEDESQPIGLVRIPEPLFEQMRSADVIKIELNKELRIKRLVKEYAKFDINLLKQSILKITKRLGGLNTKISLEALERRDFYTVADITLSYYDKAYNFGLSKRKNQTIHTLSLKKDSPDENAKLLINFANKIFSYERIRQD